MRPWLWLLLASACSGAETYSYWVQPCSPELARKAHCEAADPELAAWALEAWQSASDGGLLLPRASAEEHARIRVYWVSGTAGLYGETRDILVDGKRGAIVYVLPDVSQLGPEIASAGGRDRLFRDAVVYLTCLHESGHALGLPHTADFDDIMYSFRYGGDILEYFSRYRRRIGSRARIHEQSAISPADRRALRALYPH